MNGRIILCPDCGTSHDETHACPCCAARYRRAFGRVQRRQHLRRRLRELARALYRFRLAVAR